MEKIICNMKTKWLALVVIIGLFTSCAKEVPEYVGNYTVSNLRDECTDPAKNVSVGRAEYGICLNVAGGRDCIELKVELKEDMTYVLTSQITELRSGGAVNTKELKSDDGPYTVSGVDVVLSPSASSPTKMKLINGNKGLDWFISENNGCRRLYGLVKN